jgi:ATP/maltotriose-dependent transcriptional regulator MalT
VGCEVARFRAARAVVARHAATEGDTSTRDGRDRVWRDRLDAVTQHWDLTRREDQVLRLMLQGLSARQVAGRMGIVRDTVRTHLRHIREKSGQTLDQIQARVGRPPGDALCLIPPATPPAPR